MTGTRWLWVMGLEPSTGAEPAGTPGPPRLCADRRRPGTGILQVRGYRRRERLDQVLSAGLDVEQHDVHRRALHRYCVS